MKIAPYGSWVSPITAEMLTVPPKFGGFGTGQLVGNGEVIAARSDPQDGGRVSLWRLPERTELTPNNYVRTALHEYGGGEWAAAQDPAVPGTEGEIIVYSDFPSNDLRIIRAGADQLLAKGGQYRYGGLNIDLHHQMVLAVREDHSGPGESIDSIVGINLNDGHLQVLAEGADFYSCPSISPTGQLAWVEWNHPNMPWDTTSVMTAPFTNLTKAHRISTGVDESAIYPAWAPDRSLIYLSDKSGFWNFYRWDGEKSTTLHQAPYDFCGPMWVPDPHPYCIVHADKAQIVIGCSWLQNGTAKLGVLRYNLSNGQSDLTEIPTDAVSANIKGAGAQSTVLLGYADRRSSLAVVDWDERSITPLPLPIDSDEPDLTGYISVAQPVSWDSEQGLVHAWYYPPTNKDFSAPPGELPPVQVLSHGGPTSNSLPTYSLGGVQYWTSRGIGILDVNYSGSSGYGRAYRERLKGNWGIVDVRDCAAGALILVERGLADPARLSIKGGSAGGFTTLASLAFTDVFTSGISLYGIGDLEVLAKDTHKFESRYLDGLVAPYPEGKDLYLQRSPNYHLEKFNSPMLILQGLDDKVVPPQLAYAMRDAIAAKGIQADLITFAGEGHGFRKAENIITATEAELNFLGSVYGFSPA